MTLTDIYTDDEHENRQRAMRYVSVAVKNVTGIMNRVLSLLRRKRYNLEQVSVTFDRSGEAYLILAIDAQIHDINHVMQQIKKLYDVHSVTDVTDHIDQIYHIIDVKIDDEKVLDDFPVKPDKIVERKTGKYAIFMTTIMKIPKLIVYLEQNKYDYGERIIGLI